MTENPYRSAEPADTQEHVHVPAEVPMKAKVEVKPDTGEVVIDKVKPGSVTAVDKLKGYYHTLILVTGALLVLINETTPLTSGLGETAQSWISGVIVFLTALVNFLKSNETWVNKL